MAQLRKYTKSNGSTAWMFKIYLGVDPNTGKEKHTTKRGFRTQKDAKIALKRLEAKVADGTIFNTTDDQNYSFKDVWIEWREGYKQSVSESTLLKTDRMFKLHILPIFGDYKVKSLDTATAQSGVNNWSEYVSSNKMIGYAKSVMNYALTEEYVIRNPFDLIVKPKVEPLKKEKKFYETDELKKLMSAIDDWDHLQARALIRLIAFTGLRRGEALALTWDDLDEKNKTLMVNKALGRKEREGKTEIYLKGPKNKASNRIASVDQKTMDMLLEWKEFNESKWIFTNERNDGWLTLSKPVKWLKIAEKKAGLPYLDVHGLRHTHASLLFEAGASVKEVQARLGHGQASTTMEIYTHITNASRDSFAEKFSDHVDF
ncbi:site-specific integrase [Marinilactibacillus sp. Marseille-P9653]|uniref:site-specific integrase n=1 Tax=Marinilactibacillus sp. Marseille-P9653 TaxID=2866583 RepID=UPI001CE3CFA1|nr:site-specific integrase [Marinilactibacillus sp. Marseille-P9653]